MKTRTLALSLVIAIAISLVGIVVFKNFLMARTTPTLTYRNVKDFETPYTAAAEIAQALEQMKKSQDKATVITGFRSNSRQIALTFDGLTDRTTVQQILDLLTKYNAKATFFVDGLQTAEDPETVASIKKAGHRVENYTLTGMAKMENLPADRLVGDFCRAAKIIRVNTDQGPNLLKCSNTKYTEQVLRAAKACGFTSVVQTDAYFNPKQHNSLAKAEAFARSLKPGSIVSVKLLPGAEPILYEAGKTDLRPAIDKQPGLKELPQEDMGNKELVDAVEKLLISLQKVRLTTVFLDDFPRSNQTASAGEAAGVKAVGVKLLTFVRQQLTALFGMRTAYAAGSENQSAQEIDMIPTTEPAIAFIFGGLTKEAVVGDVLTRLTRLGIKATFFVSESELKKYPQTVRKIIGNGHEIGIAFRAKDGETFEGTSRALSRTRTLLREQYGITTNLVKQISGPVSDAAKEAIGSQDCVLIGQSMNVVLTRHKDYTAADQVLAEIFGKNVASLARGQILYFRLDFYNNDALAGELLTLIKKRKIDNIAYATSFDNPANNPANDSPYTVKPVGKILNNVQFTYQYPLDLQKVPGHLRHEGPSPAIDGNDYIAEASKRYIGQKDVNYYDRMIGFSKMAERRLDKTGYIHTDENVIFLTFDDWGSDAAINKLLYVLRKHNVPATFFVLTNNVQHNPNLLRAIAVEGHNIGSHSDKHRPMAVADPQTGRLVKTAEKEECRKDFALSYQKLRDIIGDVMVNGKSALTRFFRPPQLAISREGLEALFETGYEFIISGSTSTRDYEAQSVKQLAEALKAGVYTKDGELQKGAILVMHMSDTAIYTAMALDIMLTANDSKPEADPTKFKIGRLPDFLPEGYSQMERKKSLQLNGRR